MTNLDKLYGDLSIESLRAELREELVVYNTYCKKLVAESDWVKLERLHKRMANVCEKINVINFYIDEKESKTKAAT